ncbi:MAG TPA: hypothetical protein PLV50_10070 [Smithella sp.]|nr:hypothetical protein [Smithella sp.]MDM7986750.1 hypothetical protein [Smithella sp.]HNY50893.1 hypothetical protein [Smithella sp.]HOG90875.1 hypothetical protein [Smithella sp.]HOU50285.1 hypothetical protein [Smithella sp.]
MKIKLLLTAGIIFLFSTVVLAVDKPASPVKPEVVKANIVKAAKMHATGKVIEISAELIKIERTLKGSVEAMGFTLDKPTTNIMVGDSVKIEYTEHDGRLTASKVSKITYKKKEVKAP